MATMSFMDVPETETILSEAYRVIKPKGFLQFSICHPCFDTPHRRNLRDENGTTYAIEVGDYYNRKDSFLEWTFSSLPEERKGEFNKFKTISCHRTMSEWLNLLIKQGFRLEEIAEPMPDDETIEKHPMLQDAQVVSYFLIIRAVKP